VSENNEKKEKDEEIVVEGQKIEPGEVPEPVIKMADEAKRNLNIEEGPTKEVPDVYNLTKEEAEKLEKKVDPKHKIPVVSSNVSTSVPPQCLLMALNNAAFLLCALIPGGSLIFAAVLFANLKILPRGVGKNIDVQSGNNEDLDDKNENKNFGHKEKGDNTEKEKSADIGAKEEERQMNLGIKDEERQAGIGEKNLTDQNTAPAGGKLENRNPQKRNSFFQKGDGPDRAASGLGNGSHRERFTKKRGGRGHGK
jgi:hypothetical protein